MDLTQGTMRNNRRIMSHFESIALRAGIETVDDITVEFLDHCRRQRPIQASTWVKELEILRHFLGFCVGREWIDKNPARKIRPPRVKPRPITPYTPDEFQKIVHACDVFGRDSYERQRARAMVLLLWNTGLRASDVAVLRRDRVLPDGRIHVHTLKTGQGVLLPIPAELGAALDVLPRPRNAPEGAPSEYLFWSGNGTTRAVIRDVTRTLARVFAKSGVPGAHAHRFRHTLATEVLEGGGTAEDAATILGNSPTVIRKHYAQWTTMRQERILSLLQNRGQGRATGTFSAQS